MGRGQACVGVREFIGREGHAAFGDFFGALLEFAGGALGREKSEGGKIEMPLGSVNVAGEPPADRLNLGVPRILRVVRVAVVAGGFE